MNHSLYTKDIGAEGARSLSNALMNENNKITKLDVSSNGIRDDVVSALSIALMNENNQVTTLG